MRTYLLDGMLGLLMVCRNRQTQGGFCLPAVCRLEAIWRGRAGRIVFRSALAQFPVNYRLAYAHHFKRRMLSAEGRAGAHRPLVIGSLLSIVAT